MSGAPDKTSMPSKFVLRDENTVDNPFMARLYGKGITQGRTVVYNTGDNGGRTSMLVLLAQGARERSDALGCSKVIKVLYAGFEIPEFTNGVRNWLFHPGTITNPPVYQAIPSVNTTTNDWNIPAHGLVTGDFVALHQRGADVVIPASTPAIKTHTQYLVWRTDANNIKILNQVTGTPLVTNAFDITTAGTHLDRLFVYKANNAYYFDPIQGRPTFFGGITITFSGIAYLEILLPANLSNGTDEPTNLKVIMQGKKVYDIVVSGETIAFDTATIRDDPNNALVSVDGLVNDQKTPITRYHKSFVDWRNRCDSFIDWQTDYQPVAPISFPTVVNATYTSGTNRIAKTTATNAWDAWAVSSQFVGVNRASCELVWNGVTCAMHFNTANGGEGTPTNRQGVKFQGNNILYVDGNTDTVIAPVAIGDRVRMTYEAGLFVVYKNGVAQPSVSINQTQKYATFYMDFVIFTASGFIDQIGVAASTLPVAWAAQFYSDVNWTVASVATTFPFINLAGNGVAPFPGVSPWGWSAIFKATIVPSFSELYTFGSANIDDTIELRVNGTLVLSGAYPSSPTGTMTLVAGQAYSIEVKYQQSVSTISNPYLIQVTWQSPSQALQFIRAASVPPRPVKRFQGGFVATEPTPAADLFELELGMSPGCAYADVDGQIRIVTTPDRTPCFTFNNDPSAGPINVAKMTVKRQNARITTNFWRYVYRDDDDDFLQKKYVFVDRKARRAANGGKLIDFGQIIQYGVLQQTQMERIGETFATLSADLDIGWTVEGFLDSLVVCKGAFVNVIDPESGYTAGAPALAQVTDEKLNVGDVETRTYELRIVTPDFYSDTAHGGVMPPNNSVAVNQYLPPGVAQSMTLAETTEPLPDNRYVSTISGDVNFISTLPQFVQPFRGRVFRKFLTTKLTDVISYVFSTNLFTVASPSLIPLGTTPLLVVAALDGNDVPGATFDAPYYVVNVSGSTFKLSRSIGGAATTEFTANASTGLALYAFADWVDTLIDVFPDDNGHGTFEIIPANKSLALVRVQTFSQAGSTIAFSAQLTRRLNVTGVVTTPAPPTSLAYIFDGVSIRWGWTPSVTFGVNRYRITDGAGNFISDVLSSSLWTETARGDIVTRRVYAVSDNGVLSATYAEATFVKPIGLKWSDPTNCQINLDNSITKTGSSGLNSAVWLSQAMLTDLSSINFSDLSGAPDKIMDQYFGVAQSQNLSGGAPDFIFAFHLKADGTVDIINNLAVVTTPVGTYTVGDTFIIRNIFLGTPSWVFAYKRDINGVETMLALVDTTGTGGARPMPWYAGLVVTTQGTISKIDLRWATETIPIKGLVMDRAQNLVNATYNNINGIAASTGGTGDGSSGLSFPDALPPHTDGGWFITATGELAVGLNITDSNQTAADIDYSLKLHPSSNAQILHGTTVVFTFFGTLQGAKVFIGREAGNVVVRLSGSAASDSWSDATLAGASLILDASFRHDIAPVSMTVRRHFLANAAIAPLANISFTEVGTKQVATIGGINDASNFPAFLVVNPVLGNTLVADQNGVFINKPVVPITADPVWLAKGDLLAGTGPSAAAIRSVGANNLVLTADSSQVTGLKWDNPLTVGRAVASGAPNRVLYSDAAQNFAESADLTFDGAKLGVGLSGGTSGLTASFEVFRSDNANWTAVLNNTGGVGRVLSIRSGSMSGGQNVLEVIGGGHSPLIVGSPQGTPAAYTQVIVADNGNFAMRIENNGGTGKALRIQNVWSSGTTYANDLFQAANAFGAVNRMTNSGEFWFSGIAWLSAPSVTAYFISNAPPATGASNIESVHIGFINGQSLTTGAYNTGIGSRAFLSMTTGTENVAMGYAAGGSITSGTRNTLIGTAAGGLTGTSTGNTLLGWQAGYNVTGDYNTCVGFQTGGSLSTGTVNVCLGIQAGNGLTTGSGNILIGYLAGGAIAGGTIVAIGQSAGQASVGIFSSVFIGTAAGSNNVSGSSLTYIGAVAGQYQLGSGNVAIGSQSLFGGVAGCTGINSVAVGNQALLSSTTGSHNIGIGIQAGYSTTTGVQSTYIGSYAGLNNNSAGGNVFIGYSAGFSETGANLLYISNSSTSTPLIWGDFSGSVVRINGKLEALASANQFRLAFDLTTKYGWMSYDTNRKWNFLVDPANYPNGTNQYVFQYMPAGTYQDSGIKLANYGAGYEAIMLALGAGRVYFVDNTGVMGGVIANLISNQDNCQFNWNAALQGVFVDPFGADLSIGINVTTTAAALHVVKVTEQLRLGYNTSNYFKTVVDANANVTFDLVASSGTPKFTFAKSIVARVEPRCQVAASSATPTANADTDDAVILTAMTAGATIGAPTGTPVQGQELWYRFKDNGTSRTIAYNAIFRAVGITLPTATVISKTLYLQTKYNATDTKWDVLAVAQE